MLELIKKYRYIILAEFIPYLFLLFILVTPTKFEVDLPGGIRPVENVIDVDSFYEQKGSFNTTFVLTYRNMTIFQKLVCDNFYQANVLEIKDEYAYIDNKWAYKQGEVSKESSIYASLIAGYEAASLYDSNVRIDYEVIGRYVYNVSPDINQNAKELNVGDVIKGATSEEVSANVNAYLSGDADNIIIYRKKNGKYEELSLAPTILEDNGTKKLGITIIWYCYQINDIYPSYDVKSTTIGGNSGGLMQTLSIFNHLTEFDYTMGFKIAGTGAINTSGGVEMIGAIEQKIYTANRNNVKLFFVPKSQYEEAMKAYNRLKNPKFEVVPVETFNEAVSYLDNMAKELGLK